MPKTRGVLEVDPQAGTKDQPPMRRANQTKESYEKELEEWWTRKLDEPKTNAAVFRQRADALKTKMTSANEPAPRGPPPSAEDLDFLKADNPVGKKIRDEISSLQRQNKELDIVGQKLKRADEYRKELKAKEKRKTEAPPADWRKGVCNFMCDM